MSRLPTTPHASPVISEARAKRPQHPGPLARRSQPALGQRSGDPGANLEERHRDQVDERVDRHGNSNADGAELYRDREDEDLNEVGEDAVGGKQLEAPEATQSPK